ncbi:MAG: DNA-binding protein [Gammaproteobacteria bacterium]|nr:MAG: DNA-binding protein [Gammaproteobacteria bacterium]
MNRKELVAAIAEETDQTLIVVGGVVDSLFSVITDALADGEEVVHANFGKFHVQRSKARKGRNPATGEAIDIAAKNHAKFKPRKVLKDALN